MTQGVGGGCGVLRAQIKCGDHEQCDGKEFRVHYFLGVGSFGAVSVTGLVTRFVAGLGESFGGSLAEGLAAGAGAGELRTGGFFWKLATSVIVALSFVREGSGRMEMARTRV